jgi:hypothetical protein
MLGSLLAAAGVAITPARAGDMPGVLDPATRDHIEAALEAINMAPQDLGFAKDHGEPLYALGWIRETLRQPLLIPTGAEGIVHSLFAERSTKVWDMTAALLEVTLATNGTHESNEEQADMWEGLDPVLVKALSRFMNEAHRADALLTKAFERLDINEQRYLAASYLCGALAAEDRPELQRMLTDLGIATADVERAIAEANALDPEPAATNYLALASRIDLGALLQAGQVFQQAVRQVYESVGQVQQWPNGNLTVVTDLGLVRIASIEDDTYVDKALLIIEPGGQNTYRGHCGVANGLDLKKRQRLSAIIDVGGKDQYRASTVLSPGTGLFGISIIIDGDGDDLYNAAWIGQGAGLFGIGWVDDRDGNDTYSAYALSQGAATYGFGYLRDRTGHDSYTVAWQGQAFAGTAGLGFLVDEDGSDRYFAGGREPDHERNDDRFLSLAQGFAIGMRPFAGGGVAALVDFKGNDTYIADIYGQGVSYWYSAGFLIDVEGHDTYRAYQYGQGTGIHLSHGLLFDGGGNDTYTGGILVQGSAHDYAVGMLIDRAGNDAYTANHDAQGHAMNNALAILVDAAGNDGYFAADPSRCQGTGNNGGHRDYGSLALLLDLGGADQYSSGAADGARLPRPLYGIVYDIK